MPSRRCTRICCATRRAGIGDGVARGWGGCFGEKNFASAGDVVKLLCEGAGGTLRSSSGD